MQAELVEVRKEAGAHEVQNAELRGTLAQQQELMQSMQVGSSFRLAVHAWLA